MYFELSFLVSAPPVALLLPVVVAGLLPAPPGPNTPCRLRVLYLAYYIIAITQCC